MASLTFGSLRQVRKILVEKDICVRGLAHPAVSGGGTERFMEKIKQQQEADRQQVQPTLLLCNQVIFTFHETLRVLCATLALTKCHALKEEADVQRRVEPIIVRHGSWLYPESLVCLRQKFLSSSLDICFEIHVLLYVVPYVLRPK